VSAYEVKLLSGIEKLIQQVLTRKLIDGFEPNHSVPETRLSANPVSNKPKKAKVWNNGGGRSGGGNRSQGNQRSGNTNVNGNSGNNSPRAKQASG
jgi:ATP-dependent RNA helicase RhlE